MNRHALVREFMRAFQQPTPDAPELLDHKTSQFRFGLVMEEAFEAKRDWDDAVKRMDGICDLLYVAHGWAVTAGIEVFGLKIHAPNVVLEHLLPTIATDAAFCCEAPTTELLTGNLSMLIGTCLQVADVSGFAEHVVDECFAEVHRSNMSKLWTSQEIESLPADCHATITYGDAYIVKRSDGKVIKSPSYSPANLEPILKRHGLV